jgi:hypothetical protein
MTILLFNVVVGMMLATSMLMAGFQLGRRRALASLAKLVDEGSFRLERADGRSASSRELLEILGTLPAGSGQALSKVVLAGAFVATCVAAAVAFVVVSSAAP